ncbi:DUF21 domain-containing protein At2g14520 isoform X5 [Physcomitrium patens]|uniref:CNNM transmembrane domain-containing protein n=1 Tax=Physcomitrium patens TaxID=3218 RepID=A0A7I4FGV3_PHYPA|nr:DUF21 domain-containing protein At2g14520-like isoform X4 [Physcomitrium patens]|eukprot:XP_024363575.1 DUF21 domain-containing protein At2g14520-like isoform X4 [Physcomitrella patens]
MVQEVSCCGTGFWGYIIVCFLLVIFAGLMSGLTLGLMSLGIMDLEVLIKSGSPTDKIHAEKILPVVKNQHLLLCTLLVGNAMAMEALPIFLDSLVSAWGAILISVTLILMFGEIIPQAVCSQHGLAIGAAMAPVVRVLVALFFPITYPISKAGKGGELTHDETTIIAGALEMSAKTAVQAMTPISSVFSLDVNAKLDLENMNLIMARGHSRIPVYSGKPNHIIGLVLVKNLLAIRPQDETSVKNCTIRKLPRVGEEMPLYDILNEFQKGHSHMAVVVKYKEKSKYLKNECELKLDRKKVKTPSSPQQQNSKALPAYKYLALDMPEGYRTSNSGEFKYGENQGGTVVTAARAKSLQGMDELQYQRSKKWERSPDNVLDIEKTAAIHSFSSDEEVTGLITMEDVIEELLQEEILDETDEYIDVHARIKVNLLPPEGKDALLQ